jgi:isopentenyl phosphate kinase
MKKPITLIKLGGSVITNKDIPMSLRNGVLPSLVKEIVRARKELKDEIIIVGHGQGSYAHVPATKYKTMDGFINKESLIGMAIVQDSAAQLNRRVVHEFLKHDVPAVSWMASNSVITKSRKLSKKNLNILLEYLNKGLFPVTCGDVLVDEKQGCTIWSTEEILKFLALEFSEMKWPVKRIIHVTEVAGVLDAKQQVVPKITQNNWGEVRKLINGTHGFDVTGGMKLKVEESLQIAKQNISSIILSGLVKNNLYKALIGQEVICTEIHNP